MEYHELDVDHPLIAAVKEHVRLTNSSYRLKDDEVEIAKVLVDRGFLYYAQNYEFVRAHSPGL